MPGGKSLQDQVDEVRELVASASEALRQANWAMEMLVVAPTEAVAEPHAPRPSPVSADAEPDHSAAADEPPERRRRHLRWARGAHTPPPGGPTA